MHSNRCRGMSLIGEYRFLIAEPMVFDANQEIGVRGVDIEAGSRSGVKRDPVEPMVLAHLSGPATNRGELDGPLSA